jgi:outer membrane protein assembly factor BamB
MLYSLNAATGSVNWKVNAHGIVGMAYADRVLFTTQNAMAYLQGEQCSPGFSCRVDTTNGTLSARNPNTGVAEWSTEIHGQALGIPTAADGMIYMTGAYESGGSTVYGIDAASGSKAWSEPVNDGEVSTPAVSSSGVYVAYSCDRIYDFDPSNGAEMWKHLTNCEGGGGDVPVLDGPYLLVQEAYSGIVLNASTGLAATGEVEGGFPASEPPAVTPGNIFLIDNDQILSQSFPLGTSLWTAVGDPEMDTSPIVVNGTIYEGSRSGMLYAFSSKSGALEWTEQLPGPLTENIGEGDGHLVVPAGDTLTTFEPSS